VRPRLGAFSRKTLAGHKLVSVWRLGDRTLDLVQPLAAGIVNVTADSMYEGARSVTPEQAIADGLALVEAGFDMLDVGAVAARSGPPVPAEVEAAALVPAIEGLTGAGVPVSADTFSVEVARAALEAGAVAVNDISGGSEEMFELVAETGCGYVLMHIEGPPREDRIPPVYGDVVAHVMAWFAERIERMTAAGVAPEQIAIDPGPDFDKGVDDTIELVGRISELQELGRPVMAAISRKDYLGAAMVGSWEARPGADERGAATLAAVTLATSQGAEILRLHDPEALDAMRVAEAIRGV
jgi:dihydropteroate synthase